MFGNTQELAENKLLLLYIFKKIQHPLSNTSITEIILENNFLNYFQLQQYLSELVESGFLSMRRQDKKQVYTLSENGKDVLEYFHNRISEGKKEAVEKYLAKRGELVNKEIEVWADYSSISDNNYSVCCKLIENNLEVIEIKYRVNSISEAKELCAKWKSNFADIYDNIKDILTR